MPLNYKELERLPKPWRDKVSHVIYSDEYQVSLRRYPKACQPCNLCIQDKYKQFWQTLNNGTHLCVITGLMVCEEHLHEDQRAIHEAIRQRAKGSDNWTFMYKTRWRIFYTIKAIICILLRLHDHNVTVSAKYDDWVDGIAVWNYHQGYWSHDDDSWTELQVGYGVFKNWYYQISYM